MNETSFNTILGYSPYDNKCPDPFIHSSSSNEKGLTNEELFFKNFFVEYPKSCEKIMQDLKEYIDDPDIHYLIFSGASGSGKTTFLNAFFKNESHYHYQFINLIENPSSMDSEDCIRTTIKNKIGNVFTPKEAKKFKEKYFNKKNILKTTELSFLGQQGLKTFIAFCNSFSRDNSKLSVHELLEALNNDNAIDSAQLLSLYMLSYIVYIYIPMSTLLTAPWYLFLTILMKWISNT